MEREIRLLAESAILNSEEREELRLLLCPWPSHDGVPVLRDNSALN